jgi:uncharacterized lipoprotein YmbA
MKRRVFTAGAALALAGCAATKVNSYRLAAISVPVQAGGPASIAVRNVGLPGYLNQNGIVETAGPYVFNTYDNEVWAESLGDMLQAVMVQDLAQILPGTQVLASGGAIEAPAARLVELNVERFDPNGGGDIVLIVQVAIKDGTTHNVLRTNTIQFQQPAGLGAEAMAAAMSEMWAQAAEQVALLVK